MKHRICLLILAFSVCPWLCAQAQSWQGRYETIVQQSPWQPTGLFVPGNGVMHLPPGNSPWAYSFTHFENNVSICTGKQMVVELQAMNPASGGGLDAFDIVFNIAGNCGNAWAYLIHSAWAQTYGSVGRSHSVYGTTSISNQPSFVQDLSTWGVLRIEINPGNIVYRWNGAVIQTLPAANGIGESITQLIIRFKGSGSVRSLRVYDGTGRMVYDENFQDALFAPASPCNVALTPCATILSVGFSSIKVIPGQGQFLIHWETQQESGLAGFEVQRSTDQQQFETVGYVEANGQASSYAYAEWTTLPAAYFRIAARDTDGNLHYSPVVLASQGSDAAFGNCFYLNGQIVVPVLGGLEQGCRLDVLDLQGHSVCMSSMPAVEGRFLKLPIALSGGSYCLRIHTEAGSVVVKRLIVFE